MKNSGNKAIIVYGAPGSGKGTQAKFLADKFNLYHFDTGDYLRKIIYDPLLQKNKIIQRERKLNESGILQTPEFVLKVVSQRTKEIIKLNQGIVYSGSPRTLFEAFGNNKNKGLMEILVKGYGKKNVFIFNLDIPEKEAIKRNSKRSICSVCKAPILGIAKDKLSSCAFCGGKIIRRVDDNPEIMKTRLKEYSQRTKPIFAKLKKGNYKFYKINGEPMPYKIHQTILKKLG
ncbi:nucleoside monophosphate kinase [Candidatus Wolfebacteria bacterium]|nr:nucleoside monophosphate kinase [Candidatus Wolfebacteria bacterium]